MLDFFFFNISSVVIPVGNWPYPGDGITSEKKIFIVYIFFSEVIPLPGLGELPTGITTEEIFFLSKTCLHICI